MEYIETHEDGTEIYSYILFAERSSSKLQELSFSNYEKFQNGRLVFATRGSYLIDLRGFKLCPLEESGVSMVSINGRKIPCEFTNDGKISMPESFKAGSYGLSICGHDFVIPAQLVEYTSDSGSALGTPAYPRIDYSVLARKVEVVHYTDMDHYTSQLFEYRYLKFDRN